MIQISTVNRVVMVPANMPNIKRTVEKRTDHSDVLTYYQRSNKIFYGLTKSSIK